MTIKEGAKVSLEYTLKLEDATVVDTNVGGEPLTYTQGSQQIIPGLEKKLEGLKEGESHQIVVPPEEAYGAVNPSAFQEVSKEQIPSEGLKVGAMLQGQDANGRSIPLRVAEIRDESVLLDFNHPLAGETLHFDIKILNVEAA